MRSAALKSELYAEADCLHEAGRAFPLEGAAEAMIEALCDAAEIWTQEMRPTDTNAP